MAARHQPAAELGELRGGGRGAIHLPPLSSPGRRPPQSRSGTRPSRTVAWAPKEEDAGGRSRPEAAIGPGLPPSVWRERWPAANGPQTSTLPVECSAGLRVPARGAPQASCLGAREGGQFSVQAGGDRSPPPATERLCAGRIPPGSLARSVPRSRPTGLAKPPASEPAEGRRVRPRRGDFRRRTPGELPPLSHLSSLPSYIS